jgi:hypothetical protein
MDTFFDRIGLGCARFGGGIEESNSRRLLDMAVDCGIRYFDTAPAYGGRASERIVGLALRDMREQIQLCTKVGLYGSAPTPTAKLRALARTAVRTLLPDAALSRIKAARRPAARSGAAVRGYGNFDPTLVRSSVERSLTALQTDHLDCLMLHEPRLSDPQPELAQLLDGWKQEGMALRLGVGTYSHLDDLPQFGEVAQFAVGARLIKPSPRRILIGHGVLRDLAPELIVRCMQEEGVLEYIPALAKYLPEPHAGGALLLNGVLFGTEINRVLVSTTSLLRLQQFVSIAKDMFHDLQASISSDCAARLGSSVRRYFAGKSPDAGP